MFFQFKDSVNIYGRLKRGGEALKRKGGGGGGTEKKGGKGGEALKRIFFSFEIFKPKIFNFQPIFWKGLRFERANRREVKSR